MFKFKIGDTVVTKNKISFNEYDLVNVGEEGIIIHIDNTAETTQPYLIEFKNTNYPHYGNKWWCYEDDIKLINE